tara:strand:+ start:279 stop:437 length:159 start_codon:yes stop_codon:yes gene_type:complete
MKFMSEELRKKLCKGIEPPKPKQKMGTLKVMNPLMKKWVFDMDGNQIMGEEE